MVLLLELVSGPGNAVIEVFGLVGHKIIFQAIEDLLLVPLLSKGSVDVIWLTQVQIGGFRWTNKIACKEISSPGNSVLDLVWKAPKRAHGKGLFRRVL